MFNLTWRKIDAFQGKIDDRRILLLDEHVLGEPFEVQDDERW